MPGAFLFGCEGPRLRPEEAAFFREADPWGFILFARNLETPDQIRALTGALRDSVGRDAPVLIDQEGGRVERMGGPHWSSWPPPLDQMEAASDSERVMFLRAAIIGAELRDAGIDVNCTPTADIGGAHTHPFLLNRTYGRDVETVVARARANAQGCLAGGVLPVVKHMPGHGRGAVDSHLSMPVVDAPRDALERTDFEVFRQLADLPLGMTAHVEYARIDSRPGTISPVIHEIIRDWIGFGGLLMTDDISMEAMPGDMAARCRASLEAGCDLILHCNGEMDEMEIVASTCPPLDDAAEACSDRALAMRPEGPTLDIDAARAELRALTS